MGNLPNPEIGDAWLNNDTKALKYRLDTKNYTVLPQSWYIAGENFDKSGYVVSIDSLGRIVKTDSATRTKTIGINLNACNAGEPIEIQREGNFEFSITEYPTAPFLTSEIGKVAYVIDTPDGQITTDKTKASLGYNNLIEIGIITSERSLNISVDGDGRGPLEYSEFEFIAGESIDASLFPVLVSLREDGKVYKTSKQRAMNRERCVGFIVEAATPLDAIVDGTKVIVRKTGLVSGFSGLQAGAPVFAGGTNVPASFGTIIQNQDAISAYYDSFIHIGYAYSTTQIVCNIQPPYFKYDDVPIGGIILCDSSKTEPDTSYLFTDGSTLNAVTHPEYQELYDVIGNTFGGIDNTNFVLPNLNDGPNKFQIKYSYFYQKQPTNAPVFWIEYPSRTSWEVYSNTPKVIDVTGFGIPFNPDDFKDVMVKIYAKKAGQVVQIPDHFVYNNGLGNVYYGYTVSYVDTTHIQVSPLADGLAFIVGNTVTVLDNSWEIKIVVVKNERFNRYRDVNADYTLDQILNWIELPYPTGYLEINGKTKFIGDVEANNIEVSNVEANNIEVSNIEVNNEVIDESLEFKKNNVVGPTFINSNGELSTENIFSYIDSSRTLSERSVFTKTLPNSMLRVTSQIYNGKLYMPQHKGNILEIYDIGADTVYTINIFYTDSYNSFIYNSILYLINSFYLLTLDIFDKKLYESQFFNITNGTQIKTAKLYQNKLFIPLSGNTTLKIFNTLEKKLEDVTLPFSRERNAICAVGNKLLFKEENGTNLEIYNLNTKATQTVTTQLPLVKTMINIGHNIYMPSYNTNELEIFNLDTKTSQVISTTFSRIIESFHYKNLLVFISDFIDTDNSYKVHLFDYSNNSSYSIDILLHPDFVAPIKNVFLYQNIVFIPLSGTNKLLTVDIESEDTYLETLQYTGEHNALFFENDNLYIPTPEYNGLEIYNISTKESEFIPNLPIVSDSIYYINDKYLYAIQKNYNRIIELSLFASRRKSLLGAGIIREGWGEKNSGYYVQFSNGLQFCFDTIDIAFPNANTQYFSKKLHPKPFKSILGVYHAPLAQIGSGQSNIGLLYYNGLYFSNTNTKELRVDVYTYRTAPGNSEPVRLYCCTIGFWK